MVCYFIKSKFILEFIFEFSKVLFFSALILISGNYKGIISEFCKILARVFFLVFSTFFLFCIISLLSYYSVYCDSLDMTIKPHLFVFSVSETDSHRFFSLKSVFIFFYSFLSTGVLLVFILVVCLYFFFDSKINLTLYRYFYRTMIFFRNCFVGFVCFFNFFNYLFYWYSKFLIILYKFIAILFRKSGLINLVDNFFTPWWYDFDPDSELRNVVTDSKGSIAIYYGESYICSVSCGSLNDMFFLLYSNRSFFSSNALLCFIEDVYFSLMYSPGDDDFDLVFPNKRLDLKRYFSSLSDLFDFLLSLNYFNLYFFRFYLKTSDLDFLFMLAALKVYILRSFFPSRFSFCILSDTSRFISFKSSYISFIFCIYSTLFCVISSNVNYLILVCYYILFIGFFIFKFQFNLKSVALLFYRVAFVYFIYTLWFFNPCFVPFLVWFIFYNPFVLNVPYSFFFYNLYISNGSQ